MQKSHQTVWLTYTLAIATGVGGVALIGFEARTLGWGILGSVAAASLLLRNLPINRHLPLILFALAILGLTPINTAIDLTHFIIMAAMLSLTIIIPYLVSRYAYRETFLQFPIRTRRWPKELLLYLVSTAVIAYFLFPYYLISTGSYHNWTVEAGFGPLATLFMGTNGLGIWDELFFVTIVLALLRRHLPFWLANAIQASLWTAFLFELGFRGWGPLFLFPFALSQGYVFRRTKSLICILAIHLTLDLILYLALIHAHHPDWMPVFLVSPYS